jgi:hypothetical protein
MATLHTANRRRKRQLVRAAEPAWIRAGGWRPNSRAIPEGVALETVQLVFSDIPSAPSLKSFHGGPYPQGNWHWEPEGCVCSSEPSHWRPARA